MFRHFLMLILIISSAAITACGGAADEKPVELVDEVLALSGLNDQAEQYPEIIQQSLVQYQGQVPSETYTELSQIMEKAFDLELIKEAVRQHFLDNYDEANLREIKVALETPLGQKMTGMKTAAAEPEAMEQMSSYVDGLQANRPPAERLDLIENLDVATRNTEISMAMIMGAIRGTSKTFGPELYPEDFARESFIDSAMDAMRPQVEPSVMLSGRVYLLFTFRDASDEELSEYIGVWEKDSGKWFTGVANDAMLAAVTQGNARVAEAMAARGGMED